MADLRVFVPDSDGFPDQITSSDRANMPGGAVLGAALDMATFKITDLGAGTAATDAVNKSQLDAIASGLDPKEACEAATIQNLSLDSTTPVYNDTGGASARGQITFTAGPTTIDGVTLADADRILVKDETGGLGADANGIWVRTSVNTWDRATDFDGDAEVNQGAYTLIKEGTANAGTGWYLSTDDPITIGGATGTNLAFTQLFGPGAFTGGDGINISAGVVSVDLATISGLEFTSGELRIDVVSTNELSIDANGLNVEGVPTLFNIGATAVGATVTAPNLDTLTDGSNADALHVHAGAPATEAPKVENTYTTIGAVSAADPVFQTTTGGSVSQADAVTPLEAKRFVGISRTADGGGGTVEVVSQGLVTGITVPGSVQALIWLAEGGGLSASPPPTSGSGKLIVGIKTNTTELFVQPEYLGTVP